MNRLLEELNTIQEMIHSDVWPQFEEEKSLCDECVGMKTYIGRKICGECGKYIGSLPFYEHYKIYHPEKEMTSYGVCECYANEGCVFRFLNDPERKIWKREIWDDEGYRGGCPDCGGEYGKVHHSMCEYEHCPKCDDQINFCDCIKVFF